MPRFYIDPAQVQGDSIIITGPDVKHIGKVLRLAPGDEITVLDGTGNAYSARLEQVGTQSVEARVMESFSWDTEPPLSVTLVQGIPKGEKMEAIIQKCTELGVARILPVITARTVVTLEGDKKSRRRERWQRVAEEASKQSGRTRIPEVEEPCPWSAVFQKLPEGCLKIIPYEREKTKGLRKVLEYAAKDNVAGLTLFIGPEGGFEPLEMEMAVKNGAVPVSLGPRILRTETAGPAVLAAVMYALGDLGG